jgi:hypothetical protein
VKNVEFFGMKCRKIEFFGMKCRKIEFLASAEPPPKLLIVCHSSIFLHFFPPEISGLLVLTETPTKLLCSGEFLKFSPGG